MKFRMSHAIHEKICKIPLCRNKKRPSPHPAKIFRSAARKTCLEKTFFAHIATDISPVFRPQTHKYPSKRRLTENISEITKISRQMQQKD